MNTAKQVASMIDQWKAEGKCPEEIAWNAALLAEICKLQQAGE